MAENKKSFVLYSDIWSTIKFLDDNQAGKLFKHILKYVNDEDPETQNLVTQITFEPIKQALKRDLKKYDTYIKKQRVNGQKGGRPKKSQKTQPLNSKPKKADSVIVSDSDSVIVNDNVSDIITKEDGGQKKTTPPKIQIDFSKLIKVYHFNCTGLPKVEVLSKTRKDLINMRFKEYGKEKINTVLEKSGKSNFMNGENDRNWKANFDWIFKSSNFIKILEGVYDNKEKTSGKKVNAGLILKNLRNGVN